MARRDLVAITLLTTTAGIATSFREVPATGAPPAGGFASLDALVAYVRAARGGRYTMVPLLAGTLLRRGALGDLGGRSAAGVALRLPPGRVAESVMVPPLQSANAAIVAGDQVDVLLTLSTDQLSSFRAADQPAGPQETQQLLQHVLVVAADPPVYTLALRLQEALLLKYVKDSAMATIELAPCSSQDTRDALVRTLPILPESFSTALASTFLAPRWAHAGALPAASAGRGRGRTP